MEYHLYKDSFETLVSVQNDHYATNATAHGTLNLKTIHVDVKTRQKEEKQEHVNELYEIKPQEAAENYSQTFGNINVEKQNAKYAQTFTTQILDPHTDAHSTRIPTHS